MCRKRAMRECGKRLSPEDRLRKSYVSGNNMVLAFEVSVSEKSPAIQLSDAGCAGSCKITFG